MSKQITSAFGEAKYPHLNQPDTEFNSEGENIFIAESGIKSKKDIEYLQQHNINVFLIGESLMKGDFFET